MRIIDISKTTSVMDLFCCKNYYYLGLSQWSRKEGFDLFIVKIMEDGSLKRIYHFAGSVSCSMNFYSKEGLIYFSHYDKNYSVLFKFLFNSTEIVAINKIPEDIELVAIRDNLRLHSTENYCIITGHNADQKYLNAFFKHFLTKNVLEKYKELAEDEFFIFNKNSSIINTLKAPYRIISSAIISQDENTCAMILARHKRNAKSTAIKIGIFDLMDF